MCAVSMVYEYGQRLPYEWWTPDKLTKYQRFIRDAQRFDEETDQPDCEDATKTEFMEKIMKRLDEIEKKLDKNATAV